MVLVTETAISFRDQDGTQAEVVARLEAQGWEVGANIGGAVHLVHPQVPGQRRTVHSDD